MELPCVRCGDCADACPAGLRPQALLRELLAAKPGAALAQGLMDCRECGDCDHACPSRIRLRGRFAEAKLAALARQRVLDLAAAARARFEARGLRLQGDAARQREKEATQAPDATSADAVAAAIARAQAKRRPPAESP